MDTEGWELQVPRPFLHGVSARPPSRSPRPTMTTLAMVSASCSVAPPPARRVAGQRCPAARASTTIVTAIPAHQRAIAAAAGVAPQQQQPRRGALQVRAAGGNPFASDDAAPTAASKAKAGAAEGGNPFASMLGDKLKDFKMPAMPAMGGGSAAVQEKEEVEVEEEEEAGPGGLCLPRHTSHYEPSCLELSASL